MTERAARGMVAALILTLLVAGSAMGAPRSTRGMITGTIRVNGCTPTPADLTVRARYLTSGFRIVDADGNVIEGDVAARPRTSSNRTAILTATDDPHLLRFSITGLAQGQLYQLAIRDRSTAEGEPFGPCGDLFWQGPYEALARAGDPPVVLEGFAARTQLEVLRPKLLRTDPDLWVGSDHLDLSDPGSAARSFRWRTSLPGVVAGELQIATEAFPVVANDPDGNPISCAEPPGAIVYRQTLSAAVEFEWSEPAEIDLATALTPGRVGGGDGVGAVAPVTADMLVALETGAPLWLRVIPSREDGPACDPEEDGVHGWVNLAKVLAALLNVGDEDAEPDLSLAPGHGYQAPYFDPKGRPIGDQYALLVTKAHQLPSKKAAANYFPSNPDPVGSAVVREHPGLANAWAYPGSYFVFDPGEPGWWDDFTSSVGGLITGAIDAIGFLVDQVSKAYAEIKKAAIKVALSTLLAVPGIGAACSALPADSCRKAVEIAVDSGLAAMGMPPSLPNWQGLQEMGVDYLAAEMASQTGLPSDLTEAAAHELADQAMDRVNAGRGGSGPFYDWLAPYFGFDPAVMFVSLNKTGDDLPPFLLLALEEDPLFMADALVLPRHWTGDMVVPMVLRPNVKNVAAPVCKFGLGLVPVPCGEAFKARWYRNAYRPMVTTATCANLKVATEQVTINAGGIPLLSITPPDPKLAVSMFVLLDEPTWDYGWDGKFFGVCSS